MKRHKADLQLPTTKYQDSIAGWDAADTTLAGANREAIDKELSHLINQAGKEEDIASSNLPLAGYLLARNSLGRTIDKNDVDNLLDGQKTLVATRNAFPLGRGNIAKDLQDSRYRSSIQTHAMRDLVEALFDTFTKNQNKAPLNAFQKQLLACWPENYEETLQNRGCPPDSINIIAKQTLKLACALYLQAGNCGELSNYGTATHATELTPGRRAKTFELSPDMGDQYDHVWSENTQDDGIARDNDVVIDAWTGEWDFGSAVLREDAKYQHRPDHSQLRVGMGKKVGQEMMRDALQILEAIKQNPAAKKVFDDALSIQAAKRKSDLYATFQLLNQYKSMGEEENVDGIFAQPVNVLSSQFRNDAQSSMMTLKKKSPLQQEIVATGIGRNLGMSTKQATAAAEENFASASAAAAKLVGPSVKTLSTASRIASRNQSMSTSLDDIFNNLWEMESDDTEGVGKALTAIKDELEEMADQKDELGKMADQSRVRRYLSDLSIWWWGASSSPSVHAQVFNILTNPKFTDATDGTTTDGVLQKLPHLARSGDGMTTHALDFIESSVAKMPSIIASIFSRNVLREDLVAMLHAAPETGKRILSILDTAIQRTLADRKWDCLQPLWKQSAVIVRDFPELSDKLLDVLENGFRTVEPQPDWKANDTLDTLFAELDNTSNAISSAVAAGKLSGDQGQRLRQIVVNAANALQGLVDVKIEATLVPGTTTTNLEILTRPRNPS